MIELKCSLCKEEKNPENFQKDNKNKHRQFKHYWCNSCLYKEQNKQPYRNSKSRLITVLLYSSKNLAKIRSKNNSEKGMIDIDREFIIKLAEKQNNKCAISNIDLDWKKNSPKKVSIDRIDSNKGYTKDNVRLVCHQVNIAINNYNIESFYEMCKSVVIHNNLMNTNIKSTVYKKCQKHSEEETKQKITKSITEWKNSKHMLKKGDKTYNSIYVKLTRGNQEQICNSLSEAGRIVNCNKLTIKRYNGKEYNG